MGKWKDIWKDLFFVVNFSSNFSNSEKEKKREQLFSQAFKNASELWKEHLEKSRDLDSLLPNVLQIREEAFKYTFEEFSRMFSPVRPDWEGMLKQIMD